MCKSSGYSYEDAPWHHSFTAPVNQLLPTNGCKTPTQAICLISLPSVCFKEKAAYSKQFISQIAGRTNAVQTVLKFYDDCIYVFNVARVAH